MADLPAPLAPTRLPYEQRPSVETLATVTEDEAVRRRFDYRNHWVLRVSFRVFLVASAIELANTVARHSTDASGEAIALANLFFSVAGLLVLRRIQPGASQPGRTSLVSEAVARRAVTSFRFWTISGLALQALFLVLYSARAGSAEAWLIVLAFIFSALRLLPSEALLLHGLLAALTFGATLVPPRAAPSEAPPGRRRAAASAQGTDILAALLCNAGGLAIGLASSRKQRRLVVDNWRTLREAAREQLRMREELEFARRVQLSMLPAESPALDWIEMSGRSLPATEVGGDYYDYFAVGTGRVAVVSADVAGHGMASGLVLSGLRSCLALLADELASPAAVVRKLDGMVRKTASHRMLVTLAIALFDRGTDTVTVASAGHPPILLRRAASGRAEPIEFSSLPLGANLPGTFGEKRASFATGDLFLLYTDGLYEAVDADKGAYGLDRLARTLEGLPPDISARQACDAVLADLAAFTGRQGNPEDDVTLVAVRVV
jgi:serine phosphatase RsbU (regulator of sigma subunit)